MTEKISRKLIDLAWFAGVLDGEGNFYARAVKAHTGKKYLSMRIRVNNTDVRMISKISEILSNIGVKYFYTTRKHSKSTWRTCAEIVIDRQKNCLKVLEAVKPFINSKRDQVDSMLDIIYYVKSLPKGGNTTSYLYSEYPHFIDLMGRLDSAVHWYFEPMFLSRVAHKSLILNENKQLVRQHIRPKTTIKSVTDEDMSWLGGIIDGEGSLFAGSIDTYKFQPYIDVTNTDVRMISKISQIYEGLNLKFMYVFINMKKRKETNKNQLSIRISFQGSMRKLLNLLLDYTVNKKDQVEKLLDVANYVAHKRENKLGQYREDAEYRMLFDNFIQAKKHYQDPQRLIRKANVVLDIKRESPIHVGDNVNTSERMYA